MKIIKSIKKIQQILAKERLKGRSIGFVPTMGALHEGHLSLIRQARRENDIVVVSIFVNPTQFGPKEDFKKYPRNFKKDALLCEKCGVDFIFYPDAKAMYPKGYKTYVNVEDLGNVLCGKSRPGHFKGVATVVTKLFNIIGPDLAYFGSKDAQQAIIIKRMVEDLNMPLKIKVMPTVREKDGLAMSSRNIYLNKKERKAATALFHSLKAAEKFIKKGEKDAGKIIHLMRRMIQEAQPKKIDYIEIVDAQSLLPVKKIKGKVLIALAVWFGKARLIDNIIVHG
ncbi:MAG: pantoate--beta-alanine ligase [Candidatus Omnitrophica bacterium]|nr:pantoate--beta-alanine ligase [Candidatus Omnitrophota bacterium]